jgi:hypothetical protein
MGIGWYQTAVDWQRWIREEGGVLVLLLNCRWAAAMVNSNFNPAVCTRLMMGIICCLHEHL